MYGPAHPGLVAVAVAVGASAGLAACAGPESDRAAGTDQASAELSTGPRGPSPTALGAELHAIGLDVSNLPPLHELDPRTRSKVMVTFNRTLGVDCDACHDESDYAAPTPRKEAATKAWDDIVRKLTVAGGGALYCDSCHYGTFHFLDRSDTTALKAWMRTNFVDKLARADGTPMACSACHEAPPTSADR